LTGEIVETRTRKRAGKGSGLCPTCGARIAVRERLLVGELVSCEECRAELEVAGLYPLVFVPLAKVEEDEDDYDV
jgi:lysine biosynthesis protein LysW